MSLLIGGGFGWNPDMLTDDGGNGGRPVCQNEALSAFLPPHTSKDTKCRECLKKRKVYASRSGRRHGCFAVVALIIVFCVLRVPPKPRTATDIRKFDLWYYFFYRLELVAFPDLEQ